VFLSSPLSSRSSSRDPAHPNSLPCSTAQAPLITLALTAFLIFGADAGVPLPSVAAVGTVGREFHDIGIHREPVSPVTSE